MCKSKPILRLARSHWSDEEKDAVIEAYKTSVTADEFFAAVQAAVPSAPKRTTKAYLTFLNDTIPAYRAYAEIFKALHKRHCEDKAALKAAAKPPVAPTVPVPDPMSQGTLLVPVTPPGALPVAPTSNWVDEIDSAPLPPSTPPIPARAPNFVKPAVKPDPNATMPRYFSLPTTYHTRQNTRQRFDSDDIAETFGLPKSRVVDAFNLGQLPAGGLSFIAFTELYNSMCDGHDFDQACMVASKSEKDNEVKVDPIVPAEDLYATTPEVPPAVHGTPMMVEPPVKVVDKTDPQTRISELLKPVPPVTSQVVDPKMVYALEALRDGVLDVVTVLKLLHFTDAARTGWALGLLVSDKVTVEQAAKLIK